MRLGIACDWRLDFLCTVRIASFVDASPICFVRGVVCCREGVDFSGM